MSENENENQKLPLSPKEHAQVGNALVDWFNSQEVSQADALMVMSKVVAKILVRAVGHGTRDQMTKAIDTFNLNLVNDVNAHLFGKRWG